MTRPVFEPEGPWPAYVEISNGIQKEPTRVTGQYGARLEYQDVGKMVFCVEVVDREGDRQVTYYGTSYDAAIFDAETNARELQIDVHDNVSPGPDA